MDMHVLSRLLQRSQFHRFLEVDRNGLQLPSFIAVVEGQKPAMDMWVKVEAWGAFERLAAHFDLRYYTDSYFDRHAEQILNNLPRSNFTTTRAALSWKFAGRTEAHVFLAKTQKALNAAVGAGWYPLVVDGCVVEKHLADHEKFGEALGYPICCRRFFRRRNDWYCDNSYYAAYLNTPTAPQSLSNGLLRHTAFYYAPHLPCSFSCDETMKYGAKLRTLIADESPDYNLEIDRRLASPMLCLSELHIYRFEGKKASPNQVDYESVEPINPTSHSDLLYKLLAQGDSCAVDANIVRVLKKGVQIGVYAARADKHGPEIPFIVECA